VLQGNIRANTGFINHDGPLMTNRSDRSRGRIAALAIPVGVLMLLFWTIAILTTRTPGWMHLFLTLGVFLVVWGIVRRGTPPGT
jgi:hypothetical protein